LAITVVSTSAGNARYPESTEDRRGLLDEVGHLVQQVSGGGLRDAATGFPSEPAGGLLDGGSALIHIGADAKTCQRVEVLGGRRDFSRRRSRAAQPMRHPAARHPGEGEGDDLGPAKRQEPAHRTAERNRSGRPAHALGERQLAQHPRQGLRQDFLGRAAGLLDGCHDVVGSSFGS
jgi:hypothetical protein